MGKRKLNEENKSKEIVDQNNKEAKKMLDAVSNFSGPSTSAQAVKQKNRISALLTKVRRDAVDTQESQPTEKSAETEDVIESEDDTTSKTVETETAANIDINELGEFRNEVKEMFTKLSKDMKSYRRSIQYDIKKLDEKIDLNSCTPNKAKSVSDFKKFLHLETPIKTLIDFKEFDKNLLEKANNDALINLLSYKTRTKNVTEAIGLFFSSVMSPELQKQFSGCGKPTKGVSKESFVITNTYKEFKGNPF